ncbi:hypothetical protein N7497_001048 [Penicillium chrysogenum]|nr:hypothetical protein N7497_001048 [Penicillium chrysogenum]
MANKLAIPSISISQYPGHLLDKKIRAAASCGFAGIEIVYNDLEMCLNPSRQRLALAKHWMDIACVLDAPYLQVPSIFATDCSRDKSIIVGDLQRLADLGAEKPTISIAFKALSWGVNCSTWESALELVNKVNRPNFGLCMDKFHEFTRIWGDNASPNGKQMDADLRLRDSLARFVHDCPVEKIFYVQLSDAERFDPPYSAGKSNRRARNRQTLTLVLQCPGSLPD